MFRTRVMLGAALFLGSALPVVRAEKTPCPTFESKVQDARFKPGQVWSYTTRPDEPASTLTILQVDRLEKIGVVIHVRVDGIRLTRPDANTLTQVEHMPFTRDAMLLSVGHLLRTEKQLPTLEGYDTWKADCGGVYKISVRDAVDVMQQTYLHGK